MPFGLDLGETLLIGVVALFVWVLPLAVAGWALLTLARLRAGQQELLTRMTALERRLSGT